MLEHPRHAAQPPSPGGQRSAGGSWKQRTTRGKEQLSRWLTIYKGETKRSTKAILEDDTEECRQLRTLASGCQCKHHAALSLKRTVWVKKTTRKKDGIPRTTKPSLCARDEYPKKNRAFDGEAVFRSTETILRVVILQQIVMGTLRANRGVCSLDPIGFGYFSVTAQGIGSRKKRLRESAPSQIDCSRYLSCKNAN